MLETVSEIGSLLLTPDHEPRMAAHHTGVECSPISIHNTVELPPCNSVETICRGSMLTHKIYYMAYRLMQHTVTGDTEDNDCGWVGLGIDSGKTGQDLLTRTPVRY